MNYGEWAVAYRKDANRILKVIEKKRNLLNEKHLSPDARKLLNDSMTAYRRIYRELLHTSRLLKNRGERYHEA
ncbi:hypothetical protein [Ruminococcus sp.]|uniref:hypothetical protein n=1 Tax=Ruminococcus sp. TaxID=41978 RepID=UPI00388F2EE2